MKEPRIDRLLFFTASTIAIAVCIPLGLIPEQAEKFISDLYSQIATNFGVFYQLFAIGTIGFLVWLASSDYGRIRLGGDGDQPDYSTFSWVGMLFCAGTGASLLVWSGVEWAYYVDAPPLGAVPRSAEAFALALAASTAASFSIASVVRASSRVLSVLNRGRRLRSSRRDSSPASLFLSGMLISFTPRPRFITGNSPAL